MAGRTVSKWTRVYVDGVDLSGYSRAIGPLAWTFDEAEGVSFLDPVKGVLPNQPTISVGTLNAILDNTAVSGLHAILAAAGVKRTVMVAIGMRANPAQGDPVFMGEFEQKAYLAETSEGIVTASIPFENWSVAAASLLYGKPWGWLLHPSQAETAVNAAIGIDDAGGASAKGGYLGYHLFSSNGTVTLKVQDAAVNTNPSFADLAGATSGSVDASSSPKSGLVAISPTATVRQYLRWQLVFGTATTATFALGFVRG